MDDSLVRRMWSVNIQGMDISMGNLTAPKRTQYYQSVTSARMKYNNSKAVHIKSYKQAIPSKQLMQLLLEGKQREEFLNLMFYSCRQLFLFFGVFFWGFCFCLLDGIYLNPFLQGDHVFAFLVVLVFDATFLHLCHHIIEETEGRKVTKVTIEHSINFPSQSQCQVFCKPSL